MSLSLETLLKMNPTFGNDQSLLINSKTNESDLSILLDSCEDYMLTREQAEWIKDEVVTAMRGWRELATRLCVSKHEVEEFQSVFDKNLK